MHEKQLHTDSCFVTLTYENKFLPKGGTLVKRDLQLFMKRLRKRRGGGVRFYACGEYGDVSFRPHYHLLLFGCEFGDKKYFKEAPCGEKLYHSQEVAELWPYGHNVIGAVTFDSAAYVARYIMKKVTGPSSRSHYELTDSDGVVHQLLPEFTLMSRRPGIGSDWFAQYGKHAYLFDTVVINGKEVRPPRFYDTRYDLADPTAMSLLRVKRRVAAMSHRADNTPDRRKVCEKFAIAKLQLKGKVL
jgi:hypothetical protein